MPERNFRKWLNGGLALLDEGIISYYPNTVTYLHYPGRIEIMDNEYTITPKSTCATFGKIVNEKYHLYKIADVKIPYLFDLPLDAFSRICIDNVDSLKQFGYFFAKNIAQIDFNKENEIADFEYSLHREVKEIEILLKKKL